jgi:hypothetical protein
MMAPVGGARWAQVLALISIANAVIILPPVLPKEYSYFLRQDYRAESLERPGGCKNDYPALLLSAVYLRIRHTMSLLFYYLNWFTCHS